MIYNNKIVSLFLQKMGDPITLRYNESLARGPAFNELGSALQQVRKFLDLCDAKDEKFNHLEKSDVDKVRKCLKEKSEWFDKQMNTQNKLKKYENVAVLASQILQTKQVRVHVGVVFVRKQMTIYVFRHAFFSTA